MYSLIHGLSVLKNSFIYYFHFLYGFLGFGQQTKNGMRNSFLSVGMLSISSLIGFIYLYQNNDSAAYFLMLTRFWEMSAGCILFILFKKRQSIKEFFLKKNTTTTSSH